MSRRKCCFTLQPCEHLLPLNRTVLSYVAFQLSHDRILALLDVAAGRWRPACLPTALYLMFTLCHKNRATATKAKPTKKYRPPVWLAAPETIENLQSLLPPDLCSGSKQAYGISAPLKTRLPNPKKICSRRNTPNVNIDPQAGNVITQLCRARRAQNLVARLSK